MNASVRARWAIGMLATALAMSLVKPLMLLDPDAFSRAEFLRVSLYEGIVFVGSAVAWLIWQSHSNRLLRESGLRGMKFTPSSSVWWWFVPLANLVMPPQAIDELWRASDASRPRDTRLSGPSSPLVWLWWSAVILERVLIIPGLGVSDVDEALVWETVSNVASMAGAAMALALVLIIDGRIRRSLAVEVGAVPSPSAAAPAAAESQQPLTPAAGASFPVAPTARGEAVRRRVSKPLYMGSVIGGTGISIVLIALGYMQLFSGEPESARALLVLWLPFALYGAVFVALILYKTWAVIDDGHARATPGKAVGFLFIPFFNLYWVFQGIWGLAQDYNKYLERHGVAAKRLPEGLFLAYCILILSTWIPLVGVFTTIAAYVVLLMMVSKLCDAINALANAPATPGEAPPAPEAISFAPSAETAAAVSRPEVARPGTIPPPPPPPPQPSVGPLPPSQASAETPGAQPPTASAAPPEPTRGIKAPVVIAIVAAVAVLMLLCGIGAGVLVTTVLPKLMAGLERTGDDGGGGGAPAPRPESLEGRIAYQSAKPVGGNDDRDLYVVSVAPGGAGSPVPLTAGELHDFSPQWSPDGRRIAFTRADLGGSASDITSDVFLIDAFVDTANPEATARPLIQTPEFEFGSAWSPDGSRVLTTIGTGEDLATIEIWAYEADGSGRTQLTNNRVSDEWPAWSPDGGRVVYSSGPENGANLFLVDADGSANRQLTSLGSNDVAADWSPDGSRIAFARGSFDQPEEMVIYTLKADGTGLRRVTTGSTPEWSPEGGWIAFSRGGDIWAVRADGTEETRITTGAGRETAPSWTRR